VVPELGHVRLSELRRTDLNAFVERLVADGHDPSTIQTTLMPLRAIYRRAVARGIVEVNPTTGLELPAVRSKRDRIASPAEAASLIEALPRGDRALWATAMYAGLRRGELMALRWEDIDLGAGLVRVERSWDAKEGFIEPKSAVGRRTVPIASVLRDYLVEHRVKAAHTEGLVFGKTAGEPFSPTAVRERSKAAWQEAGMRPITLHESRHTFASLMIAAGVNAKALKSGAPQPAPHRAGDLRRPRDGARATAHGAMVGTARAARGRPSPDGPSSSVALSRSWSVRPTGHGSAPSALDALRDLFSLDRAPAEPLCTLLRPSNDPSRPLGSRRLAASWPCRASALRWQSRVAPPARASDDTLRPRTTCHAQLRL